MPVSESESLPARIRKAPPGRQRLRIDWKRGAVLLIEGEKPAAVAAALGIEEDRLWRHLRNSLRFQFLLRQARERRQLLGRLRFESVSADAALRGLLHVETPDGDALKWLAGASGLGGASGTAADAETRDVIKQLSDSGRRPPNQALHRRIARERKGMDAQVAEAARFLASLPPLAPTVRPVATPPEAPPPDIMPRAAPPAVSTGVPAPAKSRIMPDKPALESDKTRISPDKGQISADKAPLSADKTRTAPDKPAELPPRPPAPDRIPPDAAAAARRFASFTSGPTIVDLTDIQGRPLPGVATAPPE